MDDGIFNDELHLFGVRKRLNSIEATLGQRDSEVNEVLRVRLGCFQLKERLHLSTLATRTLYMRKMED